MGLLSRDALLTLAMAVAIFLFLVDLMHWRQCWAARYPPGPMPLPGLGNLLHVDFYNTPYSFYKVRSFPVLLRIPGLPGKVFPGQKAFFVLLDELLTEHRMTWDPAQPPRDLTDAFLAEVEKAKGNQPESSFNDENLRMVVADLFAREPWQQEIDEVIGQVRRPEMGDQARMPFTNAVIHEVQRFGDIMLVGVPHVTFHDVEGTTLITNLSSVLKDETVWEKPFRFHPEHFLDAQGHFVKPEVFMPFSAGHRVCLGEPLGRMELFLFFTRLLQRLSFSVPAGHPRPSDYGAFAVPVSPSPYELCVASR
uniref:Uncharacterized protein n=1 Tax=Castor canadensis TaxID=51338 RepID=A0A8C0XKX2_CASCN